MNGSCHFAYSLAIGSMLVVNLTMINELLPNITATRETATLLIMGNILGGILPDMDNPKSSIAKITKPISNLVAKVGKRFGRGGKYHRGILHDPLFCIVGLVLSYIYFPPLVGVFVGAISHIYLDLYNPVGLPILFGAMYINIADITSGSTNAKVFTYMNVVMVLIVGVGLRFGLFLPITAF